MKIPYRIANAVHATDFVNLAVGGMGYVNPNYAAPFDQYVLTQTVQDQITDANLITIQLGVNDGDYTLQQIEASLRNALNSIVSVNPKCQIVLIQATPYTSDNRPFISTMPGGWTLDSFYGMLGSVAHDFNCATVPWYDLRLMLSWSDFSGAGGNWAHPKTADIYYQMGNFIGGRVAQFYQN